MKVPIEKIHKVSCAIDPVFKPMPDKANKLKERLKISGPVLLYIGRIAFYKGIGNIIQAYKSAKKEIPDLNLIIGGNPTLKMQKTVEKWKTNNPDVIFYGMIPDAEMPIFYSMADIFITYSYASEGFGITPVESLACETPVICSSLPAYKEILLHFATFVEPKRPDLLSTAILQHFKNPSKFREIVNSSKDFLKQYTWKEVVNRIESVYEDYLKQAFND
jgi:glycosyltransferase involved in cell wall biosynthesis